MAPSNPQPPYEIWLRIREIEAIDDQNPSHQNTFRHPHGQWLPPKCPEGFSKHDAAWHIWTPGRHGGASTIVPAPSAGVGKFGLPDHVSHFGTTSMFFSTEINGFLEVPYDCTESHQPTDDVAGWEEDGWHRISFWKPSEYHPLRDHYPHLWIVGHGNNDYQMKAHMTPSWNNLLLPGCFEDGVHSNNTLPRCELAGKLTIILGLVGFAAPKNDTMGMIRDSFCPRGRPLYVPTWVTGRQASAGILPKRGLLVDVAYDSRTCTREQIVQWERGQHGPILISDPLCDNHAQAIWPFR